MPSDTERLDAVAPVLDDAEITRIGDRGCYAIRLGRLDEDDLRNIAKAQRDATVRALVAWLRERSIESNERAKRYAADGFEALADEQDVVAVACQHLAAHLEALLPPDAGRHG